jgi:hypothetical protein
MNKQLEDKLIRKFPQLFRDTSKNMHESCMYWGCAVNDGWYDLLHDMCEELMTLDLPEGFKFTQVKEKFAGLRVYTSCYTEETEAVIRKAESRADKTCEACGTTTNVEQRSGGWIATRCDDCEAVVQEDRTAGWLDPPGSDGEEL